MSEQEWCEIIDGKCGLPSILRNFALRFKCPGIIDEQVQTVVLFLDLSRQPSYLLQGGEVGNAKMQAIASGYSADIL
jgi:hypothetical protein